MPCPAVVRRLQSARAWLELIRSGWRPTIAAADPVSQWAERAWRALTQRITDIPGQLAPWLDVAVPVQMCVCDIWHDHILFTGDAVTGLIDFGGVKEDSVVADLARLLGSLVGDDEAGWRTGQDAYASARPLTEAERALSRLLDRTGVLLGLANWLRRLYEHGERPDDRFAVARRMEELVLRAEKPASVGA
jgi:Ser/Thr protein kinase RdoA (MazF antagonist)